MATPTIKRLDAIMGDYDLILCDVWGVIHNGVMAWTQAYRALIRAREAGLQVVLITNAPRPFGPVVEQLGELGVPRETYDAIVTSGDVTRALITQHHADVFHLGPSRDRVLFDGLGVNLVELKDAETVVCTGLFDDETEEPADYAEQLEFMKSQGMPFICANPDIVVEKGDTLLWCAGALARDYASIGGRSLIAGKPHTPIYEEAIKQAEALKKTTIDRSRILAIGDGMPTDVKGAIDNKIDLLFISDGIHSREYGEAGAPDADRLENFLSAHDAKPVATMPKLA